MDRYLNQTLGDRYEIQEIIGVGGMARVYKAYDRVDDRIVAIKILKDEYLANEEFRLRFKNESKVIAVLSHPNIVKVYDVCFGDTLQYIVMEHVEGITLKEYIENEKVLDWKEAVHFCIQILRALQHAHDKGIIHRDIKPQNILLLQNSTIKVTDFGIARYSRSDMKPVAETGALGSVHYVSPEQARGEYTDARSDIYSVGVVLYEMLTGKLPFEADCDENVAIMQMQQDAEKPSEINSAIPVGLEQITLKAMQKNPADRYQSAAEFLLDLDEFKNNPLIKFDYSYFIDKNPTKYIDSTMPIPAAPVKIADDEEELPEDGEEEDEDEPRNMTIPILTGVAISLVIIVVIILAIAFADPIKTMFSGSNNTSESQEDSGFFSKLDVFGWFSSDKIEVPNFLNENYSEILEKYPDLVIANPPQFEYNSTYENGKVCDQSPVAGVKVSKDTVIQLTVASNGEMVLIRDVTGLNYIEAETALKSLGLTVECIPTADDTKPENQVLYTEPSVNTYIENQGVVYVFYASKNDGVSSVRVPNTVGDQLSIAKAKIVAAGLNVGAVTFDSSSPNLKDFVIGQTPSSMTAVKSGIYVNLVVGDGVPSTTTADFSITLPDLGTNATIKTYLNDNAYDILSDVPMNGSGYQLSFTGSDAESTFKIYIDSSIYYSGVIDFTTDPPKFSDVMTYNYTPKAYVPDVLGLTEAAARDALKAKGFENISVTTAYSDDVPVGKVCSQSPWSSTFTTYATSVSVSIVVSMGVDPGVTEATTKPVVPETTTKPPVTETTSPHQETTIPVSSTTASSTTVEVTQ